jgi:hypothetical protein
VGQAAIALVGHKDRSKEGTADSVGRAFLSLGYDLHVLILRGVVG